MQFHTYAEKETKDIKLVIKGLPPLNTKEIEEDLISMGIQPKKVSQLKLPKQESFPIYLLSGNGTNSRHCQNKSNQVPLLYQNQVGNI